MTSPSYNMVWYNVSVPVYKVVQYSFAAIAVYFLSGLLRHLCRRHCTHRTCCCRSRDQSSSNSLENHERKSSASKHGSLERSTGFHYRVSPRATRRAPYYDVASKAMLALSIIACILVFMHVILDAWVFTMEERTYSQIFCIRQTLSGLFYFLSVFCVYLFLWIRQRMFYTHPVLRHLSGPNLIRFSWSVLVSIVISMMTFIILYFIPHFRSGWKQSFQDPVDNIHENRTITSEADVTDSNQFICFYKKKVYMLVHFIVTLAFLYFQIALQFLFAYPVFCHRRHISNFKRRKNTSENKLFPRRANIRHSYPASSILTNKTQLEKKKNPLSPSINDANDENHEELKKKSSSVVLLRTSSDSDLFESITTRSQNNSQQTPSITSFTNKQWHSKLREYKQYDNKHKQPTMKQSSTKSMSLDRSNKTSSWVARKTSFRDHRKMPSNKRVRNYVLRCFMMSLLCCFSDLAAFGFTLFTQMNAKHFYLDIFNSTTKRNFEFSTLPDDVTHPNSDIIQRVTLSLLSTMAYNGNLIINLFCLVLCYDDWRNMLFPCFMVKSKKKFSKKEKCSHRKNFPSSSSNGGCKSGDVTQKETSLSSTGE